MLSISFVMYMGIYVKNIKTQKEEEEEEEERESKMITLFSSFFPYFILFTFYLNCHHLFVFHCSRSIIDNRTFDQVVFFVL